MTSPMAKAATLEKPEGSTLAQKLRVIDLTFECLRRATAVIDQSHPELPRTFAIDERDEPSERSRKIGKLTASLRRTAMMREGLPLSLLGDGLTASERHYRDLDELLAAPTHHLRVTEGMAA